VLLERALDSRGARNDVGHGKVKRNDFLVSTRMDMREHDNDDITPHLLLARRMVPTKNDQARKNDQHPNWGGASRGQGSKTQARRWGKPKIGQNILQMVSPLKDEGNLPF
jgi:hypothetical protein